MGSGGPNHSLSFLTTHSLGNTPCTSFIPSRLRSSCFSLNNSGLNLKTSLSVWMTRANANHPADVWLSFVVQSIPELGGEERRCESRRTITNETVNQDMHAIKRGYCWQKLALCMSSHMQIIPQEPLRCLLLQANGARTETCHNTCAPRFGAHHLGLDSALPHHDASGNCSTWTMASDRHTT